MATKVVDIPDSFLQEDDAKWVSFLWDKYNQQRQPKLREWEEIRNYIFATDTTTTSNNSLPWKNTTTTPKLCQIRDNLHSNYMNTLFPDDNWLSWEGYTDESSAREKAEVIEKYMANKCRSNHYRTAISRSVYDYIDFGNAFGTVEFVAEYKTEADGRQTPIYIGPRAVRISPLDIVFNPMAEDFASTPKIIRSLKTIGEIKKLSEVVSDQFSWKKFLDKRMKNSACVYGMKSEDFSKAIGYQADGFGNMFDYFTGEIVEVLEFFGDFYNPQTGELLNNYVITIADRNTVVRKEPIPSWFNTAPIFHVGWRYRQDNLWAMGPLDNLVGMQYRIDHLENLKADAMDLVVHPPLVVVGEVEEFEWGPGVEISVDENGDVRPLSRDLSGLITANNEIGMIEAKMELYAGAPREAMGIRSPGEKTALEVSTLDNASSRMFTDKAIHFEIEFMEMQLNAMLETSIRNMDRVDVVKVIDHSLGVEVFEEITKDDLTASGLLRPVGARHYAQQAKDVQTLLGLLNSPLNQIIMPHIQGEAAAKMVESLSNMKSYNVFKPYAQLYEQAELARVQERLQEEAEIEQRAPVLGSSLLPQGQPQTEQGVA